jgi:hypothetical protein
MLLSSGRFSFLYLAYFSKPTQDRVIYRAIEQVRPRRLMEVGIGSGQRSLRMISLAMRLRAADRIDYLAVDLFEDRASGQPGLSLREAYRLLRPTGARVFLLPGSPYEALARRANDFSGIELVVISSDLDRASLARAWYYLPRMLAAEARVFLESASAPSGEYRTLLPAEIERLARLRTVRRAA